MPHPVISIVADLFAPTFLRRQRQKLSPKFLSGLLVTFCLFCSSAYSQSLLLKNSDTADKVTSEQVDEWAKRAADGDWQLMAEFAAAYLYKDDCENLRYGHRCRAMATRPEAGHKFLLRIIESPTDSKNRTQNSYAGIFWRDYARSRLQEARTRNSGVPDPEDPACKDYIKYMSLAGESGDACAAESVETAYRIGRCTKYNAEKVEHFEKLSYTCPVH